MTTPIQSLTSGTKENSKTWDACSYLKNDKEMPLFATCQFTDGAAYESGFESPVKEQSVMQKSTDLLFWDCQSDTTKFTPSDREYMEKTGCFK